MRHVSWQHKTRVLLVALAALGGFNGLAPEAKAFQFGQGDLLLAVYGNSQEYYRDLGPASGFLAPGSLQTLNLNSSPLNPMFSVGGPALVTWTLLSGQGAQVTNQFVNVASKFDSAQTIANGSINGVAPVANNLISWNGALVPTGAGSEIVLPATNNASFTHLFGTGGTLNGAWTGGGMQNLLDNSLNLIQGQAFNLNTFESNILSDVGRAILTADGHLTICGGAGCNVAPVPVPAAVVLFGSGLIGLVGIARRKLMRNSTEV